MRYYKNIRIFFLFFIISHVFISLTLGATNYNSSEIFPFFSWRLFDTVPNTQVNYGLRILRYNNNKIITPEYLFESKNFSHSEKSVSNLVLIQKLGRSVKNRSLNEKYSLIIWDVIFKRKDVEFEVVSRTYDPLTKWETGKYNEEKVIKKYNFE